MSNSNLPPTAVLVHVYYWDVWQRIATHLKRLQGRYTLYITLDIDTPAAKLTELKKSFPDAQIRPFANKGMDILPFLHVIPELVEKGYQQVLKLHTKKGQTDFGPVWGEALIEALIGHANYLTQMEAAFNQQPSMALAGPSAFYLSGQKLMLGNQAALDSLSQTLLQQPLPHDDWGFFAGSMFWTRPQAWQKLASWAIANTATLSGDYQQDGQWVHALQRFFGLTYYHNQEQRVGLLHPAQAEGDLALQVVPSRLAQINQAGTRTLGSSLKKQANNQALFSNAGLLDVKAYQEYLTQKGLGDSLHCHMDLVQHYLLIGQFSGGRSTSLAWHLHCKNRTLPWHQLVEQSRVAGRVSIIIPVFNQLALTQQCITSLVEHTQEHDYEILLVDNGSDACTASGLNQMAAQHPQIYLIRQQKNQNFALGSNLGFAQASGEFCVFLNNDTQVMPGWLAPLIARIQQADVYATQPLLLYPDGSVQCMGVVFSDKSNLGYPIYQGMQPEACQAERPRTFQAITAACMVIKAKDFAQVKGFDPIYINGQEDIDLCLRLKDKTGKQAAYVPTSKVIHHESKTQGRGRYIDQNRWVFVLRWGEKINPDDQKHYQFDGIDCLNWSYDRCKDSQIKAIKAEFKNMRQGKTDMEAKQLTLLQRANKAFRNKEYKVAFHLYNQAKKENDSILNVIEFNLLLLEKRGGGAKDVRKKEIKKEKITKTKKMVKICAIIPGGIEKGEASSYIRLICPLTQSFLKDNVDFKVLSASFETKEILDYDVCIIQRYAITDYEKACEIVDFTKKNKIQLIFDIDDAIGNTSKHKGNAYIKKIAKSINLIMNSSDVNWFSTEALANFYKSKCPVQMIVPNSLDPRMWPNKYQRKKEPEKINEEKIKFLYMGTRTHEKDFYELLYPAFNKLHDKYKDSFEVHVLGGVVTKKNEAWINFIEFSDRNISYKEFMPIMDSLDGFHFGLAPLIDDDFNECKTDIKFLDYLAIGVTPVVSDVKAYSDIKENVIKVENGRWYESLENILLKNDFYLRNNVSAKEYVWKDRSIAYITAMLIQAMSFSTAYVRSSELFDGEYYLKTNPDVRKAKIDPVVHYCRHGWKENRLPSNKFDVFGYQETYLQGYIDKINPLLHYELIGKKEGCKPNLEYKGLSKKAISPTTMKRVCLFAAYDKDGLVDESVIVFIKELAKFCDIYFLSDSNVSPVELQKLDPFVKGAWAYRHGEYDFGSYKRLAKYHVGWSKIEEYDELLFVNDSSYLISSLKPVFQKMDNKEISWWGMQATKGIYATREKKSNKFQQKIPIKNVKDKLLASYFEEKEFDFLIGSYFLAYRKNIITDKKFQNIINGVCKQRDKKTLILKYEIGLTKYLISQQYDFNTYMDHLYPFHPIYTDQVYEMIKCGFPLFKRFFLTENHYKQKKLYQWEKKLSEINPKLDLKPIRENVNRVADATKLFKNLDVERYDQPLLNKEEFIEQDKRSLVDKNIWVFPVCAYNHNLDDNSLAVFESVKYDANIKKVILFRSKFTAVEGANVEVLPLYSRQGQEFLLKSFAIFVKHSPIINIPFPLDSKKHLFINLWHGIPLKRIGVASLDTQEKLNSIIDNHNAKSYCTIASSDIDRLAMSASFFPLKYNDIWLTGLPRHDFILKENKALPESMQEEFKHIDNLLEGRKLILYAPTFRNSQKDGYYEFTEDEKFTLYEYLEKHNIVLGIREHMADTENSYSAELVHPNILNMGSDRFGVIEVLYRKADLLITDYSSCFIDFMLTDKPMISFAYDYENYRSNERGMFYDLEFVFPGDICFSFDQLIASLVRHVDQDFKQTEITYDFKKKIFHKFCDTNNSKRVVDMVRSIEVNTGA